MLENYFSYKEKVEDAAVFLRQRLPELPDIGIILGTGLGSLADSLESTLSFPYTTIPNFPVSTAESHVGNLVCGNLAGRSVALLQGRFHYYEGYSAREITFPLRVLALLGARNLVVTNAAGGLNPEFNNGDLMVIRDHLNFIPENPLRGPNFEEWGPRFPDMSETYSPSMVNLALEMAGKLGITGIGSGVYCAIPGPSLETAAETRYLRSCGADAVGMSTVPEVIVARHAGMKVLGISVIANINDPDNFRPIILEEVIEQTEKAAAGLAALVEQVIPEI